MSQSIAMRTHSHWYHTHRDAIGFHGHRFLGMRHLGHHCLCICCLPVVSSIRILHFRSFGFEQSIPQPNLKTKNKKLNKPRTPQPSIRPLVWRTHIHEGTEGNIHKDLAMPTRLGKRVTHAHTHTRSSERASSDV